MPTRTLLLAALAVAVSVPAAYAGSEWGSATVVESGGVEGGDALYLPMGDLLNLRNIQGGYDTGNRADLNLDMGAGSTEKPGDIVLNWDVGNRTLIYDGKKNLVASFSGRRVKFHVPVKFAR